MFNASATVMEMTGADAPEAVVTPAFFNVKASLLVSVPFTVAVAPEVARRVALLTRLLTVSATLRLAPATFVPTTFNPSTSV